MCIQTVSPIGQDWRIQQLHLCRPLANECPGYDTKLHLMSKLCCILTCIYIYIYSCIYMQKEPQRHNDKGRAKTSLKKYTSHFICNVCVWEGVGDRIELQYIDPHSYGHHRCVFLVLPMLNRRPGAPLCWLSLLHLITNWSGRQTPLGVSRSPSAGLWLSLPHLVSDFSGSQLVCSPTRWLLVSPSYIIVQSPTQLPTQSLEWHVWSSSSGNKSCSSEVTLFRCISLWVYHGLLPCPISSAKSAYAISFDYWPLECVTSFGSITLEWHVWPGRRSNSSSLGDLGNVEYSFIAIAPKSTLTRNIRTL